MRSTARAALLRRIGITALASAVATVGLIAAPASTAPVPEECTAASFTQQLGEAPDAATVTLCGDVAITPTDAQLQVPGGRSITLDLAGHDLAVTGAWQRPGLAVGADATLTIDDSVGGGTLNATAGASQAGIELGPRPETATLIINGGTITATATDEYGDGAGIGGSGGDNGGTVIINGGVVHATGTGFSPGIGGTGGNSGVGNNPQPITINGGEVHATGGTGIGGGPSTSSGAITINGGTVHATGIYGPGIGGGQGWDTETDVTITGGEVHAVANGGGAAIGSSGSSPGPTVTITGGTVEATSIRTGAAIGSGQYSRSTPTITIGGDAHVTATSTGPGAAIGGGYSFDPGILAEGGGGTIDIQGGTVIAAAELSLENPWDYGAAIGGGRAGAGGTVTVAAGADVTVSSDVESSIGPGTGSTEFGSLTNHGSLTILTSSRVTIPTGVTVLNTGTITGGGAVNGAGTVDNGGSITHTVAVADGVTVTDHNLAVTFDAGEGTGGPAPMTLYSDTFAGAGLSLGDLPAPTPAADPFLGWYLTPTSGARVDDDTSLSEADSDGTPVAVTLYAGYGTAPEWQTSAVDPMTVGVPVDQQLDAAGDDELTYSIVDGALPAGVGLSPAGALTGTPTESGPYSVTIRVGTARTYADREFSGTVDRVTVTLAVPALSGVYGTPAEIPVIIGMSGPTGPTGPIGPRATDVGIAAVPGMTGTVTVLTGESVLCSFDVDTASSCLAPADLPAGSYDLELRYSGDTNHAPATTTGALTIAQAPTQVSAVDVHSAAGSPTSLSIGGLPTTATGEIVVTSEATELCRVPVTDGGAECVLPTDLAVGSYQLQVGYDGDANHEPSSTAVTWVIAEVAVPPVDPTPAEPAPAEPAPAEPASAGPDAPALPSTGLEMSSWVLIGALLLGLVGVVLLVVGRRNRD